MLIAISPCLLHADPDRSTFNGRPLLYLERSMARWVMGRSTPAAMLPPHSDASHLEPAELARAFDGLVLQGGVDVCPRTYKEEPRRAEWSGDPERDAYELALLDAFVTEHKPVLGVCRGHQLINVWRGGTLRQDIDDEVPGAIGHRDGDAYAGNHHGVELTPGGLLSGLYGASSGRINSVHHQCVKDLGADLVVEATSPEDGVIEAIRLDHPESPWVVGVQWHPEFQEPEETELLSPWPLLDAFLEACSHRKTHG